MRVIEREDDEIILKASKPVPSQPPPETIVEHHGGFTIQISCGNCCFCMDRGAYYYNAPTLQNNDAILKELQGIQQTLAQTEPMASRVVGELRDAIREHDQPKISSTIRDLTTGTIGSVIAELASAALKKFLGLP